jgi:hypothetical protein
MFKSAGNSQIDRLNNLALRLAKHDDDCFGVLSKGEQCYVALASNRVDLLESIDYTIPKALARLGDVWTASLISSWQYAGNGLKGKNMEDSAVSITFLPDEPVGNAYDFSRCKAVETTSTHFRTASYFIRDTTVALERFNVDKHRLNWISKEYACEYGINI